MASGGGPLADLFGVLEWQMFPGERVALEGILSSVKPDVSVEIGTFRGGSLERISAHSHVVHAFDRAFQPEVTAERFPNAVFHAGDSHELLPTVLEEFAVAGSNVDFALVDGDHSSRGARRDLEDLLGSPACQRTVILLHDTLNERVRAAFEAIDFDTYENVRYVDLDFVPGQITNAGPLKDQRWSGLALVVTGWSSPGKDDIPPVYPSPDLIDAFLRSPEGGDGVRRPVYQELATLEARVESLRRQLTLMERSWSWRITAPLRASRTLLRRARPR
jgi:hypothetical protein